MEERKEEDVMKASNVLGVERVVEGDAKINGREKTRSEREASCRYVGGSWKRGTDPSHRSSVHRRAQQTTARKQSSRNLCLLRVGSQLRVDSAMKAKGELKLGASSENEVCKSRQLRQHQYVQVRLRRPWPVQWSAEAKSTIFADYRRFSAVISDIPN